MGKPSRPADSATPGLDAISTHWHLITDPVRFVLRYAQAIHAYLKALLRNAHDAEEVAQEFLLRGITRGFVRREPLRGRFRDYLKSAVRNAALSHLRRWRPARGRGANLAQLPADDVQALAEQEWVSQWQQCLLDRALQALDHHQRRSPGNLFYTVVRLALDYPEDDSTALAARASGQIGRPLHAEAFRKQLSRARRFFAGLLVEEVAQTLDEPTPQQIEEELIALGLMPYARAFLPPDWRTRGQRMGPD
jgi:RNA polymerase sigma-70 factor (ECF subfamily)